MISNGNEDPLSACASFSLWDVSLHGWVKLDFTILLGLILFQTSKKTLLMAKGAATICS